MSALERIPVMPPVQHFHVEDQSRLSLLIGREAGEDVVAMITMERAGAHIDWDALVWRGTTVWKELRGTFRPDAGMLDVQIRMQIAALLTGARFIAPKTPLSIPANRRR